jgi:hypothetical protein
MPLIEPMEWVELLDAASWAKQAPLTANAPNSVTSIFEEMFMATLLQVGPMKGRHRRKYAPVPETKLSFRCRLLRMRRMLAQSLHAAATETLELGDALIYFHVPATALVARPAVLQRRRQTGASSRRWVQRGCANNAPHHGEFK